MLEDPTPDPTITFRPAQRQDVPFLVEMLADDPLGAQREQFEDPLPASYLAAFEAIDDDPNNELIIAEVEGQLAGFLQVTIIPYLTYKGRSRALIEGVRIHKSMRGAGIGRRMIEHAIEKARSRNCHVVQLTTDKQRDRALSFYLSLGFIASHEGMKLHL